MSMPPSNEKLFSKTSRQTIIHLPVDRKCRIIKTFWPHLQLEESDYRYHEAEYAALFEFLGKTLQGLSHHELKFADRLLDDMLVTINDIRTYQSSPKSLLAADITNRYPNFSNDSIARSIELAARLWLGINISSRLSVGPRSPRDSRLDWQMNQSLQQVVSARFNRTPVRLADSECYLDTSFTAFNLRKRRQLQIRWSDNLADHLRLEGPRGKRILSIFRHKIYLVNHSTTPGPTPVQKDVVDEAIRTLDILFPYGDSRTADFLDAEGVILHSTLPRENQYPINLDEFLYWRDNMLHLLRLLNGNPETFTQTLSDTHNLSEFATLWIAVFGVFCLSILFGVLATVYSIKQFNVAVKSYDLALALACHEVPTLPGFC